MKLRFPVYPVATGMITAITTMYGDLPESELFTAVNAASNPRPETTSSVKKLNQSEEPVDMTPRGVDKSPLSSTNRGLEAEGPSRMSRLSQLCSVLK